MFCQQSLTTWNDSSRVAGVSSSVSASTLVSRHANSCAFHRKASSQLLRLAFVTACVFAVVLLVGCGAGSPETAGTPNPPETSNEASEAFDELHTTAPEPPSDGIAASPEAASSDRSHYVGRRDESQLDAAAAFGGAGPIANHANQIRPPHTASTDSAQVGPPLVPSIADTTSSDSHQFPLNLAPEVRSTSDGAVGLNVDPREYLAGGEDLAADEAEEVPDYEEAIAITSAAPSGPNPISEAPSSQAPSSQAPGVQNRDAKQSTAYEGARKVDVFFATDRRPTAEVLPSMFRTFLPALAVACICWAMFIGLSVARRFQMYWVMGASMATCLGIMVLHVCILRWQEYSRLANSNATRFSVLRFEPREDDYPLHVGLAEVTIPKIHQVGRIERPSIWKLEFTESPEKHVILQSVQVDEFAEDWFGKISEQVRYASDREGFVFIHGFNVKFGDALKRTAQLATDLEVKGPVISYSWPSRGQVAAYSADEASVAWAAPNLEQLLVDLTNYTEIRKVNIVAHSMGNRALLESLERIHLRSGSRSSGETGRKLIGSLIMAAPDVDAQVFDAHYVDAINNVADRAALYFTNNDLALRLSEKIHGSPRLGLGRLPSRMRIEAIDTGRQGLFSIGHSYYGSDPVVIDDMKRFLNNHPTARRREYLSAATTENGAQYWSIDRARHATLLHDQARR